MAKNNWTRDEHILAYNLYCKTPYGKIAASNKEIQKLARIINRTPDSVAMKLANFARLDPTLKARNISGLKNGAKGEVEIWNEFNKNWEELAFESERLLHKYTDSEDLAFVFQEGKERDTLVKQRINQNFFRQVVLASYNNTCCITGITVPELLVAGHIIPWADSSKDRMNPSNGLCLNSLHDKAFDKGLMTITPDLNIQFSEGLIKSIGGNEAEIFFLPYKGRKMIPPSKFTPNKEFLEYHNTKIFQSSF